MRILQTGVTHFDPDRATPGFTLFSPLWGSETLILDMRGEVVHRWEFPVMLGGYGRLLPNGNLFVAVSTPTRPRFPGGAQGGRMLEVDWDGNVVNEVVDDFQHHDCHRLPNGHTLYASWEDMPEERAALVRGGAPGSDDPEGMYSDVVREVDADGNLVFEWHACDMEIEKYALNPLAPRRVFAWCNTTFPLPNGDVLISLRHIDTCAIVDRQTGKFRWERTDPSWGGQHDPQMLPNGNIMLFANGCATYQPHPFSRIVEFDPETGEDVVGLQGVAQPEFLFPPHQRPGTPGLGQHADLRGVVGAAVRGHAGGRSGMGVHLALRQRDIFGRDRELDFPCLPLRRGLTRNRRPAEALRASRGAISSLDDAGRRGATMNETEQKLSVVLPEDGAFEDAGLRAQFAYRDLGIGDATGGNYHAHIIKAKTADGPKIGLHRHGKIDFQLVYILKGWMRFWYEGRGETVAPAGTCILQPPGIQHDVLEWSDDLELLEVTSPRDFTTEALEDVAAE